MGSGEVPDSCVVDGEFEAGCVAVVVGFVVVAAAGRDAQGHDGGRARAEDAEDGADLGGGGGLVQGCCAVPEGEDRADCPVGRDDGASVERVEGEGVLFLLGRGGGGLVGGGALNGVFFAAGCGDGGAGGDGCADYVLGGYVDVEFWGR